MYRLSKNKETLQISNVNNRILCAKENVDSKAGLDVEVNPGTSGLECRLLKSERTLKISDVNTGSPKKNDRISNGRCLGTIQDN